MNRRAVTLPTNAADLATYGDVLLAGALLDAAWADWRAGRMALAEVFRWQRIHGLTLRGYLRLIVGGLDDGSDFRAGDPARAALPGGSRLGDVAGQAISE